MRLPNGYGGVTKLSGKRRNPYVAKKTTGYDGRGYPIYDIIGYFPTRAKALDALSEFNKSPIHYSNMTLLELHERWENEAAGRLSDSTRQVYRSAFRKCAELYDKPYKDISAYDMQRILDTSGSAQNVVKAVFQNLDDFALNMQIISNSAAQRLKVSAAAPREKSVFTDEEIEGLWKQRDKPYVDTILMLLYTGMRKSELFELRPENINMDELIIRGGKKTAAGKNRIIPIHHRIIPLIEPYAATGLSMPSGYKHIVDHITQNVGKRHTPHECRHTFRTRLFNAGANEVCIDKLCGHVSAGVGRSVYTHISVSQLRDTIELLD